MSNWRSFFSRKQNILALILIGFILFRRRRRPPIGPTTPILKIFPLTKKFPARSANYPSHPVRNIHWARFPNRQPVGLVYLLVKDQPINGMCFTRSSGARARRWGLD